MNQVHGRTAAPDSSSSRPLTLSIKQPVDGDPRLPPADVAEARGGVLDMTTFSGSAFVTVQPWPFIATSQRIWLTLEGTRRDGSVYKVEIEVNDEVESPEIVKGLRRSVSRYDLEQLRDDSTFTVNCSIAFVPGASAILFPQARFKIVQEDPVEALDLSGPATVVRGSSFLFTASGGRTPYTFTSSDTSIARMTDGTGRGTAVSAGACSISVTDAMGARESKTLAVTNPAFYIDPSPISLTGRIVRTSDMPVPSPPAGTTVLRQASGGVPPYRYVVNQPVVEIDASSGRITALRNGSAVVTVYDTLNQSASYTVTVSNAWITFGTGIFGYFNAVSNACAQAGGVIPSLADWRLLHGAYNGAPFGGQNDHAWTSDSAGGKTHYAFYTASAAVDTLVSSGLFQQSGVGWGIRRYNL